MDPPLLNCGLLKYFMLLIRSSGWEGTGLDKDEGLASIPSFNPYPFFPSPPLPSPWP